MEPQISLAIQSHIKNLPNLATRAIQTYDNSTLFERNLTTRSKNIQELSKTAYKSFEKTPLKSIPDKHGKRDQTTETERTNFTLTLTSTRLVETEKYNKNSIKKSFRRRLQGFGNKLKNISVIFT